MRLTDDQDRQTISRQQELACNIVICTLKMWCHSLLIPGKLNELKAVLGAKAAKR